MQVTKPNGNQKKYWYLHNQQYSTYALTNDNGKILETYHCSAYANTYFYTGRLLDSETNLYYFRNRYYNANQGRFISRDPLGYVDGMSLYRGYFAANGVDWSGNYSIGQNGDSNEDCNGPVRREREHEPEPESDPCACNDESIIKYADEEGEKIEKSKYKVSIIDATATSQDPLEVILTIVAECSSGVFLCSTSCRAKVRMQCNRELVQVVWVVVEIEDKSSSF